MKENVDDAAKYKQTEIIYHYGAISRFKLSKWQECIDYCKLALKVKEDYEPCKVLMSHCLKELVKQKQKMNEMDLINKLEEAKKQKLFDEIRKYGIKIGQRLHHLPQDIGASLYIDDYNILHFPVIILYDEFMQCDFIQDFPSNSTFREQLTVILAEPAPWDPTHKNKINNVKVFFETNMSQPLDDVDKVVSCDKKYKQVDLDSELLPVLQDEHHIVPQYPIFIVVAKDFNL